MARSRSALLPSADSENAEIVSWYEDLLDRTYPPTDLAWEPVRIGPTWQYDNGWLLPQATLGWGVLAWCGMWLRDKHGKPWQFTPEQARFVLWFYAVDESGDFLHHSAVLQRIKGWGKDPVAACLALAAMFADVSFDYWDGDRPVGRDEPAAWVQLVAVSQEQTQNTMKLMPALVPPETRRRYGVQVGKLNVWGLADTRQIQAVTSSPLPIEGGRPTLIIPNEIQNWNGSNGGHEMYGAMEGNAAKSEGGAARMLALMNAYRPGGESVGQRIREGWESTQGETPRAMSYGLLYDSLEAPPNAPLTVDAAPTVVEAVRGDAVWLSTKRILASILDPTNSPSESRRKWYNQITATEDAWVDPLKARACAVPDVQIDDGEPVVMWGDGSKSDDATALVLTRMSDGLTQLWHIQQPKRGETVDRDAVDYAVIQAHERFKVQAFWFDPAHMKDENAEGDSRFWWPLCDDWSVRYGKRYKVQPTSSGNRKHAVAFDMATPSAQALIVPAYEQLAADIESGQFAYAESHWLTEHLCNARRRPGRYGVSMGKDGRESKRKIDAAVCAAGARLLWRLVKLRTRTGTPGGGRVVVLS